MSSDPLSTMIDAALQLDSQFLALSVTRTGAGHLRIDLELLVDGPARRYTTSAEVRTSDWYADRAGCRQRIQQWLEGLRRLPYDISHPPACGGG
jgi:hypothetical protein